jgi:fumarate hydratase subunit beta
MNAVKIVPPFRKDAAMALKAGDQVLISGVIYTARDAAHARLTRLLDQGRPLPIEVRDAIIYYVGPTPAKPRQVIGSAGPTSSYRMDAYAPRLLEIGLRGMIGKGKRSPEVVEAMKKHGAVYFGAIGGAAALIARCITAAEVVCYEDLGSEAIRRLTVRDFPATVVIDSAGGNLYELGRRRYLASVGAC